MRCIHGAVKVFARGWEPGLLVLKEFPSVFWADMEDVFRPEISRTKSHSFF